MDEVIWSSVSGLHVPVVDIDEYFACPVEEAESLGCFLLDFAKVDAPNFD